MDFYVDFFFLVCSQNHIEVSILLWGLVGSRTSPFLVCSHYPGDDRGSLLSHFQVKYPSFTTSMAWIASLEVSFISDNCAVHPAV
jgi:hypothetical protein